MSIVLLLPKTGGGGGLTTANNGVKVNPAGNVQLGGTLIGPFGTSILVPPPTALSISSVVGGNSAGSNVSNGRGQLIATSGAGNGALIEAGISSGNVIAEILTQDAGGVNVQGIIWNGLQSGVVFDGANKKGLVKDPAILAVNQLADPNAYVTTDCLTAVGPVTKAILRSGLITAAGPNVFTIYTAPAGFNQLIRLNMFLTIAGVAGGGAIQLEFSTKDEFGNTASTSVGPFTFFPENIALNPYVAYIQKNSSVIITVTNNIPGNSSILNATLEYLGLQAV